MKIIKITKQQYGKLVENLKKDRNFIKEIINIKESLNENVDWDHNVVDSFKKYMKDDIVSVSTLISLVNSEYVTPDQLMKSGISKEKLDIVKNLTKK